MKTVEDLLEKGLIEVANKEEELKVFSLLKKYPHWSDISTPLNARQSLNPLSNLGFLLQAVREENGLLKQELEVLKRKTAEQVR